MPVILMAAAGGENGAVGVARQEFTRRRDAQFRGRQIVQTKFEKALPCFVLSAGVREQGLDFWKPERDTDSWECGTAGHSAPKQHNT